MDRHDKPRRRQWDRVCYGARGEVCYGARGEGTNEQANKRTSPLHKAPACGFNNHSQGPLILNTQAWKQTSGNPSGQTLHYRSVTYFQTVANV